MLTGERYIQKKCISKAGDNKLFATIYSAKRSRNYRLKSEA